MKRRKSFSRFLIWMLIVLEGLSLAVVIGFMYAMLDRAMTKEYRHQVETQATEIQSLLVQRSNSARARMEEIGTNSGIGVSLLLGMFGKAEELMQQLYPPGGGASFYLRHPSGQIVPAALVKSEGLELMDSGAIEKASSGRFTINPSTMLFAKPVERNGKILGHVIGAYNIADDPVVAAKVDAFRNVRLVARSSNRYMVLWAPQTFHAQGGTGEACQGECCTVTADACLHNRVPLTNFANLFMDFSDAPLVHKRRNQMVYLILLCLPLFGLTLTVSFLILKKVTSSINALAQNAMLIADASSPRDLDENRVQHVEFLHLAQAFNKVLSQVRKKTQELHQHQRHLDRLVEERTAELHASNKRLKQTQVHMIQSEKMASIGQLAAGVAHEINNPIGFVKSNLHTLDEYCRDIKGLLAHYGELEVSVGTDTAENCSYHGSLVKIRNCKEEIDYDFVMEELDCILSESREGVDRVADIVRNLRDFSHEDAANVGYADINRGIESTLNIVLNQLKYTITANKDLGELPLVKCDINKMNQVFMNLLINAGQSIEGHGIIDIRTRCIDHLVEIIVKDNGCGIPPDIEPKIFDPFFTTKDVGGGTGLGLNLAYNIVKSHNGSIEVESEVGRGTTFTVRLDVDGRNVAVHGLSAP